MWLKEEGTTDLSKRTSELTALLPEPQKKPAHANGEIACPRCGGEAEKTGKSWKFGVFDTDGYGCQACGKTFNAFYKDGRISHTVPKVPPRQETPKKVNIAIFLKPLIVLDTQKWFGEANLRLDALVVQGGEAKDTLYHPQTHRFFRVRDGDDISTGQNGLMIYYGKPSHFLHISLILSRDRKDSENLAKLILNESKSKEITSALSTLTFTVPNPQIAALQAGVTAAIKLGEFAFKLINQTCPKCIGLYRASWLEHLDNFGIGSQPGGSTIKVQDFEFSYKIIQDIKPHARAVQSQGA